MEELGFRIWRRVLAEDIRMSDTHTHGDIEINFLFAGTFEYVHGGQLYRIEPGSLAVFWAGIPHQLIGQRSPLDVLWITLPISWLLRWNMSGPLPGMLLVGNLIQDALADDRIDRVLLANWAEEFKNASPEKLRILALEVQARLLRVDEALQQHRLLQPHVPGDKRLEKFARITAYLAGHYEEDIDVNETAAAVQMHPKYLLQFFKKLCGMTLWEYVVRLRLAHAQRLLLTTDMKVIHIAHESGFGSLSAFYYAFQKHTGGVKPREFRLAQQQALAR